MLPDLPSKSKHVITDKNCKADKILDVSSPGINIASSGGFADISLSWWGTREHYQMLPTAMHYKPGEALSRSPFHPHPFLCHPHPNINIHGAAGPWRAEYIEPERRCRRGREGADKGWWKKVEWVGGELSEWVVEVKVAQHCAKGKVSNQTSQLLF